TIEMPSAAPLWKMATTIGRSFPGLAVFCANAVRSKNDGCAAKLAIATPVDFRKNRRERAMFTSFEIPANPAAEPPLWDLGIQRYRRWFREHDCRPTRLQS